MSKNITGKVMDRAKGSLSLLSLSTFALSKTTQNPKKVSVYALKLYIKTELKKRNMRRVKLEIWDNFDLKCASNTRLGLIILDKSYLRLDYNTLCLFIKHEISHIQIYRLLRNNPKLESILQKQLDDNLVKSLKTDSKGLKQTVLSPISENKKIRGFDI